MTWSGTVGSATITQQPTAGNAYSLEIAIAYDTTGCDPANGACPAQTANITIELAAVVAAGGEITSSPPSAWKAMTDFRAASWTAPSKWLAGGQRCPWTNHPPRSCPGSMKASRRCRLGWRAEANYRCTYPMGEVCGEGAGSEAGRCVKPSPRTRYRPALGKICTNSCTRLSRRIYGKLHNTAWRVYEHDSS